MVYLCYAAAYLIGSVPFGLLLGKLAGIGDIRDTGSGNIGATNMLRAGGGGLALLTLLLDAGKGFLAASVLGIPAFGALFAVIGHCFPVWLKFKGGKGVATAFGALLAVSVPAIGNLGVVAAGGWLAAFLLSGYSSLAALAAGALLTVMLMAAGAAVTHYPLILLAALVLCRHKDNIRRLLNGEEERFSLNRKKEKS